MKKRSVTKITPSSGNVFADLGFGEEEAEHLLLCSTLMIEIRKLAAFEAEAWDRQFEEDVEAGKLDALAEKALRQHADGLCTDL